MNMKCPHYMKILISLCRVDGKIYTPNYLEQQEYCKNGEYAACPLFRRREKENAGERKDG